MKIFLHTYADIISLENLAAAWEEFSRGKQHKPDVQRFERDLIDNLVLLHHDLVNHTYRHGSYYAFRINDPKPRSIHKASVRDRLVHHAVHRVLYPFFSRRFIADSFSCQNGKGVHKGLDRFRTFAVSVSRNNTRTAWVLKCDIKQFFAGVDQAILLRMLCDVIPDRDIQVLLREIIGSFGAGLPLGNLTSQLFANVYLNELDQFVKHELKVKHYIRYTDDFVILHSDREYLLSLVEPIKTFLASRLHLELHPKKLFLKTFASGMDFLGWVHFPTHRTLRSSTNRRMMRRLETHPQNESLQSYLGLLQHGDGFTVRQELLNLFWITGTM